MGAGNRFKLKSRYSRIRRLRIGESIAAVSDRLAVMHELRTFSVSKTITSQSQNRLNGNTPAVIVVWSLESGVWGRESGV